MKIKLLCAAAFAGFILPVGAATLNESTFTEIVKEVNVVSGTNKTTAPAEVKELLKAPDLVRTGADSRAELTAADQTITRVGANTVFSFEPVGRNLRLEQGSVLFHSPAGKGGGAIKTGGASAAVLGTTIIVAATADGGFKFIVLEGKGKATLTNGRSRTLKAGQMVYILPGGKSFSEVLDINLGKLVGGSLLIGGFSHELPSLIKINAAIRKQNNELTRGRATDTGMTPGEFAGQQAGKQKKAAAYGLNALDHNSYSAAVHPGLTLAQIGLIQQAAVPGGGPGGAGVVKVNH
jgi:hypothetical protein